MSIFRKVKSSTLLRCLVVPMLFLCAIFKRPLFQWFAVAAVAMWLAVALTDALASGIQKRRRREKEKELAKLSDAVTQEEQSANTLPDNELFLIRQVNFRITEQLKGTYPMVSWLWVNRPDAESLCKGGIWRIRVANTDPFNYGEVELKPSGKLTITMLQSSPLKEGVPEQQFSVGNMDLEEDELLDRVDVKSWFQAEGEQILFQMIDDLNTQGHRTLIIHEDGQVVISASGSEQIIESIQNFPPRLAWDEFCQILKEDEITATIQPDGLMLSW